MLLWTSSLASSTSMLHYIISILDFLNLTYFVSPADVVTLRWAYKRVRELARRMKYYRGELVVGHPQFSKNSPAAVGNETGPIALDAPRIQYSAEDDAVIDEYHKQNVETTWHSVRTVPDAIEFHPLIIYPSDRHSCHEVPREGWCR